MNTLGSEGEALIKSFEKLRLTAYLDDGGVWTLGWGYTSGVKEGDSCTPEQAEDWFHEDTGSVVRRLNADIVTNVNQNQFDALCSFAYNVGVGAEGHSTLLKLINQRRFADASAEFPKWDHVKGTESSGLLRRRLAEQALFNGHPWRQI